MQNKVLIEIGAQHPLVDGKPGEEFEKRLRKGMKLYFGEKEKGNQPVIYIPGSVHSIKKDGKWQTDENSLSTAGKNFLLKEGIPEEYIRADEANEKFKKDGVYNSGDECLVASQIAQDEDIDRIISVVSPVQVPRKALFYLQYGYAPEIYGEGLEKTYHNYIGEAFWSLYITYFIDHTWQDSFLAAKTRKERNRNFKITREIQELIDCGISMPDDIKAKKEQMMALYRNAQANMQSRSNNNGAMISIESEDEQDEEKKHEKISKVIELCKEHGEDESITVCIQGTQGNEIESALQDLGNNVKVVRMKSFEDEIECYKSGTASKWYHITDSPNVMNEAVQAIKLGTIPVIYSTPNSNISYIDKIEELYTDILKVKEKSKMKENSFDEK